MGTVNSFPLTTVPLADALASASYDLHKATSTTSLAIGTGAKVFTTQEDKGFVAGDFVVAISDADHGDYMFGTVTTYSGTTLTLDITEVGGSGTNADWTIRTSGPPGATGPQGIQGIPGQDGAGTGDFSSNTATSVDSELVLFSGTGGKTGKRASLTGLVKATSGVASAATAGTDYYNPGGTDVAVADGGTGASNAAGALTNLTARGQGKETIWIPAAAMWARTTNGPAAVSRELTTGGDIMIKGWGFDTTTEEGVQFYIAFPNSWNKGTITFQAYWTNVNGLTTETVSWGLSAGAFTNDDPIDSTDLGTEVRVSDTWLAANDMHVTAESAAVTVGNTPINDDLVIGQIVRSVANDNMTGDAELLGIKIFFTTNAATDA